MLAEYGGPAWLDAQAEMQLAAAWVRRKQFEAKIMARAIGELFGGGGRPERVSGAELLRTAGFDL